MSAFAVGDRVKAAVDLGPTLFQAGTWLTVTVVHGNYLKVAGIDEWFSFSSFEQIANDADRLTPIKVDEPLMLGDDEPTECLDESGCEIGPEIIRAIETSGEKWQALDVDGVSYLVVGAFFVVALHKDTDPRNVAALVRRLNTRTEIVRIPAEGDEGLGPITAGFAE